MRHAARTLSGVMFAFLVAATLGCGEWQPPTRPSSVPSDSSDDTSITGVVNGGSLGATAWSTTASTTSGMTVTVVGTDISVSVSGSGKFTLNNVPSGDIQLQFSAPGINAVITISDVRPGDRIEIKITVKSNSATVEMEQRHGKNKKAELEGLIQSINPSARTLRVANTDVSAPDGIPIRHGSTSVPFGDLAVGNRIHVKGTWQGTSVVAKEIKLQNPKPDDHGDDDDDDDDDNPKIELDGIVQNLGSSPCPAVTFTVAGTSVRTDSATEFKHGPCAHLENGTEVEVEAVRESDGYRAVKVEMREVEITSSITTKSGSCPTLVLGMSNGWTVKTYATTVFERVACTGVNIGMKVEVKGSAHPNNVLKAIRLKFEGND